MSRHSNDKKIAFPIKRYLLFGMIVMISLLTLFQKMFFPVHNYAGIVVCAGIGFTLLQIASAFHRKRKNAVGCQLPVSPMRYPKVSIVVPAHNESAVIEKTVQSLLGLTYPDFELWVVNDRSTDGTREILEIFEGKNLGRFHCCHRDDGAIPGKAAALNDIASQLAGEILCVLDADARVRPDFLEKAAAHFNDPHVAAVQARKTLLNPDQNWLTKCQQYEYALDGCIQAKRDAVIGAVELRGNGMLVRRQALQSLGGWNEQSLTEDLDLSTRLHAAGWDVRYLPSVQVWEEALPAFAPLLRQRIRWTEGSIIRYLEYSKAMITASTVSFRAKLDMCQFVFEFIAPVWLFLENLLFYFDWPKGAGESALFSPAMLLVLSLYFIWHLYCGVRRFAGATVFQSLAGTVAGYLYLSLVWIPIVFSLLARILLAKRRNLEWVKTPHYGGWLHDAA